MVAKPLAQPNRPRVLVADPIAGAGIELLTQACDVTVAGSEGSPPIATMARQVEILLVRSETKVTDTLMAEAPSLRLVGRAGAGVDNIDLESATRRGILVINAPSGNTTAAAEHTIAMMLSLLRNIPAAYTSIRDGRWDRRAYLGVEARNKVLGVVGLGRIGLTVARMAAQGLGMEVVAFDPLIGADRAEQAGVRLAELPEVLAQADVLTVHVPLSERTRGLIGKRELAAMKAGARVVNVARGGIVDEQALAEAVRSGHLAGAALDVFETEPLPADSPLRGLDRVVLTPHLGASTEEAQVNVAVELAEQVLAYLRGEHPQFAVNAPPLEPMESIRLAPYLSLASKLGSLGAQLSTGAIRRVVCAYGSDSTESAMNSMSAEALAGIVGGFTELRVNAINAKAIASERGVPVEERRSVGGSDQDPTLLVTIEGDQTVSIGGEVIAGEGHVTSINGFPVDVKAEGQFLVVTHHDRPGVLARISGLLAAADINIGSVGLGRDRPRGRAVLVMQIDDPVPAPTLRSIQVEAGADSATLVTL